MNSQKRKGGSREEAPPELSGMHRTCGRGSAQRTEEMLVGLIRACLERVKGETGVEP